MSYTLPSISTPTVVLTPLAPSFVVICARVRIFTVGSPCSTPYAIETQRIHEAKGVAVNIDVGINPSREPNGVTLEKALSDRNAYSVKSGALTP